MAALLDSIRSLPIWLQALAVQCAAAASVFVLAAILEPGISLTLAQAVAAHSLLALALAIIVQMPRWWLWIHAGFMPALLLMRALALPPAVYLAGLALMLVLYWQTFRTRVPYYPSPRVLQQTIADLLPAGAVRFVDLGSGFGGLVCELARRRPDGRFVGIELAPLPWLCSRVRARLRSPRAGFVRADYENVDLGQFDVVFAYLSPAAMPALWRKARAEMRPGSLLLSFEFDVPGAPAALCMRPVPYGPPLWGWRF